MMSPSLQHPHPHGVSHPCRPASGDSTVGEGDERPKLEPGRSTAGSKRERLGRLPQGRRLARPRCRTNTPARTTPSQNPEHAPLRAQKKKKPHSLARAALCAPTQAHALPCTHAHTRVQPCFAPWVRGSPRSSPGRGTRCAFGGHLGRCPVVGCGVSAKGLAPCQAAGDSASYPAPCERPYRRGASVCVCYLRPCACRGYERVGVVCVYTHVRACVSPSGWVGLWVRTGVAVGTPRLCHRAHAHFTQTQGFFSPFPLASDGCNNILAPLQVSGLPWKQ